MSDQKQLYAVDVPAEAPPVSSLQVLPADRGSETVNAKAAGVHQHQRQQTLQHCQQLSRLDREWGTLAVCPLT